MRKTSYILALLAAASALLISSCAKETGNGFDAVLSFSTDTPELVEVKAAAVTSVSDFYTIGYAGTTQWFPTSGGPQNVVLSGGSATFSTYRWKTNESKTFFAYSNNLPSGASASISSSGVTLTYTAIPTEASAQTDVTLGRYTGNGSNTGTAAMTFYHPLAQVVFKMGDMAGVSKIDKIEIKGVYNAGTTTLTTTTTTSGTPAVANFSWTGTSGSAKVSQTVNSLPSKGSEFGVPFMLIPQNLATQNVTISVVVTTTSGSSVTLTKKLTSGTFATGKKTVCTISVDPNRELDCNLAAYTADAGDDIFETFPGPKPNEIWYWTANEQPITKSPYADANDINVFGANIVSSTYTPGDKGVMKFNGPITKIGNYAFGRTGPSADIPGTNLLNLTKIIFPEGVTELEDYIVQLGGGGGKSGILEEVIIPRSVTSINWQLGTFGYCWTAVTVGYEDGITYSESTHPAGPGGFHGFSLTLGNGTSGIVWNCCFLKGTLITLADGSKKKVEDITYEDELLVWNFDKGCYDKAKILWLTKDGLKSDFYYKCTFSDGTVLNIVGNRQTGHRLFNATDLSFDHCNEIDAGKEIFTQHGKVNLISCELIDSVEVEYVNLITDQHINCFANEVLASARYNNRWPIDEDMKFVKDGRKIRPYREFKKAGISREWYEGMRLGEQQDSIARVKAYIDRCELNGNLNPDWKQPGFFARIWNWIKGLFSK